MPPPRRAPPNRPSPGPTVTSWLMLGLVLCTGCRDEPVLAGQADPRPDGVLVFWRGSPVTADPARLFELRNLAAAPLPIIPAITAAARPTLSPSGARLAWTTGSETRVRDLRGGPERVLTPVGVDDDHPRWSPDGEHLVLMRRLVTGQRDMVVVDVGDGSTTVLEAPGNEGGYPDWSPTGDHLVWFRTVNGLAIELLTPDGAFLRRLAPAADSVLPVGQPTFSPDGRRVAFLEYVEVSGQPLRIGVRVVSLAGETVARWHADGRMEQPAWSPDGKWIAVCVYPEGSSDSRIEVRGVDGTLRTTIGAPGVPSCQPTWAR